jgi:hypothetical protein
MAQKCTHGMEATAKLCQKGIIFTQVSNSDVTPKNNGK